MQIQPFNVTMHRTHQFSVEFSRLVWNFGHRLKPAQGNESNTMGHATLDNNYIKVSLIPDY